MKSMSSHPHQPVKENTSPANPLQPFLPSPLPKKPDFISWWRKVMEMEVHEGFSFSIREYVSRMRTVNVVKSCPFDETGSEESLQSLLPPMTVQRFIWWADTLKVLSSKSDNSSKKKKNVGDDMRVAKVKPSRIKAKAPKEKSILEIFAVAAPAKEEEPTSTNKKTNKSKQVAWTKLKKTKNEVIQKNKKKRNLLYKDNCVAFKHQQDKGEELGISKGKPGLQNLARNVSAKCGILKKDAKQFLHKQHKKSIMQEAVHVNHCGKLKAGRNVSFVKKDNEAREARKRLRPAECLNLQKFSCSDMDHKHDAGYVGTESNIVEASRSGRKELQQNEEVPFCRSLTLDATLQGNNQDLLGLGLRQVAIDSNAGGPLPSCCSPNFEVVMNSSGTPHLGFPPHVATEYLQTMCSLPECHHEGHIHQLTMYDPREKILGLPLSSKGEFSTLNSSSKGDLNQMMKSSTSAKASISLSPPSTKTFLAESYLEENTLAFAPSGLDATDSQDNCLPFHDLNPLYKDYNLFQKFPGNEKNMSKLRLMGKEFVVGEGLQDFELGHRWKDKQFVDEVNFSGSSASNVVMPDQNEVCIEKLSESYQTGSMHSFPHFDYSTLPMHQSNGLISREFSAVEKTESEFMPSYYNYDPHFPKPFPVEYRFQFHQGSLPTMSPTDFQLKNRQNLSHAPTSAIRFPFMPPELDHYQSSLSWRSDMSNLQYGHTVDRCHHPYVMPGVNHWTYPIMYREPEPYCSYGPALFPPPLLAHQAPWMFYPGVIPVSSVQKCHGKQKIIIPRVRLETGNRDHNLAAKASDQPLAASKYFEDAHNTETTFRSWPAQKKSRILIHGEHGDDMRAHRVHPWSGPVKLTAGAKHILRDSQGMDKSSSRSTNPYDIPLVAATTLKAFQI